MANTKGGETMYLISINSFRNPDLAKYLRKHPKGILDREDSILHTESLCTGFNHSDEFLVKIGFMHNSDECLVVARYTVFTGQQSFSIFDVVLITTEEAKKIIDLEQKKKNASYEERIQISELYGDFEIVGIVAFFEMAQVMIKEFCMLNYQGPCMIIQLRRFRFVKDSPGRAFLFKLYDDSEDEEDDEDEEKEEE